MPVAAPNVAYQSRHDGPGLQEKRTKIFFKLGEGTLNEPFLYWVSVSFAPISPFQLNKKLIEQVIDPLKLNNLVRSEKCEEIAKQQARENKCLAAVIRKENHDTRNGRDPETGMLTGNLEVADNHITLYLGKDINDIQLGGHVYTNTDKKGVPIGVMDPEERKIIPPGQDKCSSEFWAVRRQPYEHIDPNNVETPTSAIRMGVYPVDHGTSYYLRPSQRDFRRYRERDRSDPPRSRSSRDRSRSPRRDASENRNDPPRSGSSRDRSRSPRREPSTDGREVMSRMSRRDLLDKSDLFYTKDLPRRIPYLPDTDPTIPWPDLGDLY